MKIKAITLWEPWASLIADGRKRIETRHWYTHHRGLLAIHAGAMVIEETAQECGYDPWKMPNRQIVAIAYLGDCVKMDDKFIAAHSKAEKSLGDFAIGRFGWIITDVLKLKKPVPCNGRQGLWNIDLPKSVLPIIETLRKRHKNGLF